jgi:hypothetical protein
VKLTNLLHVVRIYQELVFVSRVVPVMMMMMMMKVVIDIRTQWTKAEQDGYFMSSGL